MRKVLLIAGLAAAGLAAYTGGVLLSPQPEPTGVELDSPIAVGDLDFESADGSQLTLADFDGDVTALFFGYTRCPDVCPLTMARLADTYRDLGEPDDFNVVMVTIDPGFDTPEITQNYANAFHEDFIGVGGSNEQIAEAAAAFYVAYNDIGTEVVHTDAVMLLDRGGNFRMLYTTSRLPSLTADLQGILADRSW